VLDKDLIRLIKEAKKSINDIYTLDEVPKEQLKAAMNDIADFSNELYLALSEECGEINVE